MLGTWAWRRERGLGERRERGRNRVRLLLRRFIGGPVLKFETTRVYLLIVKACVLTIATVFCLWDLQMFSL